MFTGIVTDMGEVLELEQRGDLRARIGTVYDVARVDIGASIACEAANEYRPSTARLDRRA